MTRVDDELDDLRKRAYGREADIHLDSEALERLRELEQERSPKPRVQPDPPAEITAEIVETPAVQEPDVPDVPAEPAEPNPVVATLRRSLAEVIRRIANLRRSTVLIALSVVAFAVAVTVVLTLVQRVQTDPLQVGASQIARLEPDSTYAVPAIFGGPATGSAPDVKAYQGFHGLRVLVSTAALFLPHRAKSDCLSVYVETDITDPKATSFSGQIFSGCEAGKFPAMAQFDVRTQGLPQGLHSAVAPATSLQFVYDKADDEVVVFASK